MKADMDIKTVEFLVNNLSVAVLTLPSAVKELRPAVCIGATGIRLRILPPKEWDARHVPAPHGEEAPAGPVVLTGLAWDAQALGPSVKLTEGGLCATRTSSTGWGVQMGNQWWSRGRHEVTLLPLLHLLFCWCRHKCDT